MLNQQKETISRLCIWRKVYENSNKLPFITVEEKEIRNMRYNYDYLLAREYQILNENS